MPTEKMSASVHNESGFFQTLKHSLNFLLSNVAVKAVALLSLPVMTRLLTPEDYGILNVFGSWQTILVVLITLNCYVALGRYYYEPDNDLPRFFGTSVLVVLLLFSAFLGVLLIFREQAALLLGLPISVVPYLAPLGFFFVVGSWFEQINIPLRRSLRIALRNVANAYLSFGLSVVVILFLDKEKYLGSIYASLALGVAFAAYYTVALRPYIRLAFSMAAIKYMLWFSIPLIPYSLSGVILAQFDRVMINHYSGAAEAGLYSFAYNIGMLLTFVISALGQAWTPEYFRHMDAKDDESLNADIDRIYRIIVFGAYSLILFGQEMGMLLGKETYHPALPIIPVVVVGYVFYALFTFSAWNMQYAKKNLYLSLTVLVAGLFNIGLNVYFLPRFGYVAAAYTTAAAYLFLAVAGWFVSRVLLRLYSVPLRQVRGPLAYLALFTGAYLVLLRLQTGIWVSLAIKGVFLVVFAFLLARAYIPSMLAVLRSW